MKKSILPLSRLNKSIVFAVSAGAVSALVSLLVPNQYRAVTWFLLDARQPSGSLGDLGALTAQLGTAAAPTSVNPYLLIDLARSDTVLGEVVGAPIPDSAFRRSERVRSVAEHYGLTDSDAEKLRRHTMRELGDRLEVTVGNRSGLITLTVKDRDPGVAAWLSAAILDQMQHYLLVSRSTRARAERQFLEERTEGAQLALLAAEDSLAAFLTHNRVTAQSPVLQIREAQLRVRVDIAQALYTSLQRDLERARAEEIRETPVLTVVTSPSPPTRKSEPRRTLIVAVATIAAFILHLTFDHWSTAGAALVQSLQTTPPRTE